jgi:acyl carrier protein
LLFETGDQMQNSYSTSGKQLKSRDEIQSWLVNQVAGLLFVDPKTIDINTPFSSFGLSSRDAVMLSGDLEEWMGQRFSPTLVYEYPTITALVDFLSTEAQVTSNSFSDEGIPISAFDKDTLVKSPSRAERIDDLERLSDGEAEALYLIS